MSPLITRAPDELIGWLDGKPLSVRRYLGAVAELASRLPDRPWAINLCRDRVRFLIAFAAVISRGGTNLLLPSDRPGAIDSAREHAGRQQTYILSDGPESAIPFSHRRPAASSEIPQVAADHRCLTAYTSGTTGTPAQVAKSWRIIVQSTASNRQPYLGTLGSAAAPAQVVATVPPQHMYGLESSIFMPLLASAAVHPGRPLLPADVAAALSVVPAPRILVTTPAHLKALVESSVDFPPSHRIVCATAPLSRNLAEAAERRFGAPLNEIYGCSEAGSLAQRRAAHESRWRLFEGFSAAPEQGGAAVAADHLPGPVALADQVHWHGTCEFDLAGRVSDMVNVAGKRASVQALTEIIMQQAGVLDAVVFQPQAGHRLAALVVAPELDTTSLRRQLQQHLDAVLVPRPLLKVPSLPRSDTGKLPLKDVLALYEQSR